MHNYLMILLSDILLMLNFVCTKKFQKSEGTAIETSLEFGILLGAFNVLIFLCIERFALSFSVFSAIAAASVAILCTAYTVLGFLILKEGSLAIYTMCLMIGGMVVPYIWGLAFLNESPSFLRMIGLILLIGAVILINFGSVTVSKKQIFLCSLVFLLNGFVSVISKEHQISRMAVSTNDFVILNNLAKIIFGILALLIFYLTRKFKTKQPVCIKPVSLRCLPTVFLAAAFNGTSYVLQLVGAVNLTATVLYPLVTGLSVLFTAVAGRVIFKEKMSKVQISGLAVCLAGTLFFL